MIDNPVDSGVAEVAYTVEEDDWIWRHRVSLSYDVVPGRAGVVMLGYAFVSSSLDFDPGCFWSGLKDNGCGCGVEVGGYGLQARPRG